MASTRRPRALPAHICALLVVCALLGMDVRLFRDRIGQPVCALARFAIKPQGQAMLTLLGDVSHLPPDLREAEGT